jgi:hypothetical protein
MLAPKPVREPDVEVPADPMPALREAVRELSQAAARAAHDATVSSVRGAALGVFQAVASLLAVRILLLVALLGGLGLAVMALRIGSYQALGVLVAYAVLVLIPLIWLERSPRVGGPHATS